MTAIELRQLAVMFRVNDPNLGHCSVFDAMQKVGLAYLYGVFRGTPKRYRNRRQDLAVQIATQLDLQAKQIESLASNNPDATIANVAHIWGNR